MDYKYRYIRNIIIIILIAVTLFSVCFVLVKTAGEDYINQNEELSLSLNIKDNSQSTDETEPAENKGSGDMMVDFLDSVYDFCDRILDQITNLQSGI